MHFNKGKNGKKNNKKKLNTFLHDIDVFLYLMHFNYIFIYIYLCIQMLLTIFRDLTTAGQYWNTGKFKMEALDFFKGKYDVNTTNNYEIMK